MEVKIYREIENENLILDGDALEQYNTLAAELGIITGEKSGANNCPVVYPILNEPMQRQLRALCPSSSEVELYQRSTIPLEVLTVLKFCKDNEMFDNYKIWFDDKQTDPLLIGYKWRDAESKAKGYNWQKNKYLIARWGDCALEIPELLALGFERVKNQLIEKAVVAQEKANSILAHPEVYARRIVNGEASDLNVDFNTDGNAGF